MVKGGFPPPEEVSFMLLDREKGEAVPVDSLPLAQWERLRGRILWNISRQLAEMEGWDEKSP